MSIRRIMTIGILLTTGCLPQGSSSDGDDPPTSIGDIFAPLFDDDGASGSATESGDLVFDITIEAASLTVSGINISGVLSLVPRTDGNQANQPYAEVTLRDAFNDPLDTIGIAGGVYLTASSSLLFSSSGPFELRGDNGVVTAVFVGDRGSTLANKFFLATDTFAFVPGQLAGAFEIDAGSSFAFVVEGDVVTGTLDLRGISTSGFGSNEIYQGTFTGVLRQ